MRPPDQQTYGQESGKEVWYRFFLDVTNSLPQTGSGAPENVVAANQSCLYVQVSGGAAVLWVNETGPGYKTGWVAK